MLFRILLIAGLALIGTGLLTMAGVLFKAAPETLAESLPGRNIPPGTSTSIPVIAPTLTPTTGPGSTPPATVGTGSTPPAATRTPVPAVTATQPPAASTPTPVPPTRPPSATATPRAAVTATPVPAATATRVPTATLPVCATAAPTPPPPSGAVIRTPTPTRTATPGPPACRTATPTATPRPIIGASTFLDVAWLPSRVWIDVAQVVDASSDLRVAVSFPKELVVDDSDSVVLVLSRAADAVVPALATPNMRALFGTPAPIGTPGVRIEDALGPSYAAYASARLTAPSSADARLYSPQNEEQPLGSNPLEWKWLVSGRSTGRTPLQLNLELHFKPRNAGASDVLARRIWEPEMLVQVQPKDIFSGSELGSTLVKSGVGALGSAGIGWLGKVMAGLFARSRQKPQRGKKRR